MKKNFVLFALVIMICAFWILVLNRNKDESIEQTNKKIPVVNVVKRVFIQDKVPDTSEEVSFVIYNAYSYDEITANTRSFGVYRFIIK